jgi:hypothetical protein
MTSLLTDKSTNQKIHLTKVKLAYEKLCPKNLLTEEEQKFIEEFTIADLTTNEIINEKYDYIMKINGISSKVESKIKEYTQNDYTCKDDNNKPYPMCLEKLSESEITNIKPQSCETSATGGKKRNRKTGKKQRHQRRQRRQTRRHRR